MEKELLKKLTNLVENVNDLEDLYGELNDNDIKYRSYNLEILKKTGILEDVRNIIKNKSEELQKQIEDL